MSLEFLRSMGALETGTPGGSEPLPRPTVEAPSDTSIPAPGEGLGCGNEWGDMCIRRDSPKTRAMTGGVETHDEATLDSFLQQQHANDEDALRQHGMDRLPVNMD